MMPGKLKVDNANQIAKALLMAIAYCSLLYSYSAYAEVTIPTLDQVVANIGDNVGGLLKMATAFAYVAGMYFVVQGILELKHMGEQRTMMSSEHGMKKPIMLLVVGGFLLYLPSTIKTALNTLWDTPNPYGYVTSQTDAWSLLITNSFLILQLIGLVSFIRGLIILTHAGGHSAQQGTFGRGMTHIIGGILCINMYDTVRMIATTLGLSGVLSGMGS